MGPTQIQAGPNTLGRMLLQPSPPEDHARLLLPQARSKGRARENIVTWSKLTLKSSIAAIPMVNIILGLYRNPEKGAKFIYSVLFVTIGKCPHS